MLGTLLGDIAKKGDHVQVTIGTGKSAYSINPEKIHLLMLGDTYYNSVVEYLKENDLDTKFNVHSAEIQIGLKDDKDDTDIQTLVLVMQSDEVLFEYKLSKKIEKLIEQIRIYAYQKEVDEVDGEK